MRRSTLTLFVLTASICGSVHAQTARLQVIHNCADAAAAEVDVYLNDMLLLDDFGFRTATPFVDAPAGVPFTVGIAPSGSTGSGDAIFTEEFTLENNGSYIVVASGIISPSGYAPAPPFSLEVFPAAREAAEGDGTDVLVYHGSTDAPMVDVYESEVLDATIVDDLAYSDFAGYLEVATVDLTLQVRAADNSAIVAAYSAPLATLSLQDAALTVLASGFLDPSMNSDGAPFGLFVATAAGGDLLALPMAELPAPARAQVIHNSADAAAEQVDVYLNGSLLLDDFAFRTATPYVDLPSGVDLTIGIAPATSMSAADAIAEFTYQLTEGATYVIVANGIVSTSGYTPNIPFDLKVSEGREQAMESMNTDILVFHGATDAPTVDVAEISVLGGAVIVDDLAHGDFTDGYLEVATQDYVLQVQTADGTPVINYQAPLASLGTEGMALVVLASGFLDPVVNSDGAMFGLWVALPEGGDLVPLPLSTAVNEQGPISSVSVWPNPTEQLLFVDLEMSMISTAQIRLLDLSGRVAMEASPAPVVAGASRLTVDTGMLSNGSYLLELSSEGSRLTVPVVIQR